MPLTTTPTPAGAPGAAASRSGWRPTSGKTRRVHRRKARLGIRRRTVTNAASRAGSRTAPWQTLADASAAPGIGNGPVAFKPADVRFVRVLVLKNTTAHWASLRDFQILLTENGRETVWHPPQPDAAENSPAARDAFATPGFNDSAWDDQPVPSNWEMAGYSLPTYDDVDDTVGLYRRAVTVPAEWAGKRVYWHFDGALDGAEVFVNGQKAGYHESGYTALGHGPDRARQARPEQPVRRARVQDDALLRLRHRRLPVDGRHLPRYLAHRRPGNAGSTTSPSARPWPPITRTRL